MATVAVTAPLGDPTNVSVFTYGPLALTVHPVKVRTLQVVLVTVTVLWPRIDDVEEALSTGWPKWSV
jgi:hypothetical protein